LDKQDLLSTFYFDYLSEGRTYIYSSTFAVLIILFFFSKFMACRGLAGYTVTRRCHLWTKKCLPFRSTWVHPG